MGKEGAEALSHLDVRRGLDVLLARERGDVDGVLDDTELEVVADLHGKLDPDGFLGLIGCTGNVRAQKHVVEAVVCRLLERLLAEDVEGGPGDFTRLESLDERLVDDKLAAGAVDDANTGLHDADGVRVDEPFGLGGQSDVECEVVGVLEDVVDRDERDVVLAGDDGGDEGVVANERHAEGVGAAGDFEADAPEPDDAERLAPQLGALQGLLIPLARVHGAVGARNRPAHGDHQAEGELGYGDGVGARGVHHHDALVGGGIGVDVVDADSGAANNPKLGGVREEGGVGLHSGADDECVGIGEFGSESVLDLVGRDDLPARLFLEDGERGGGDFFGEDDLHAGARLLGYSGELRVRWELRKTHRRKRERQARYGDSSHFCRLPV